MNLNSKTIPIWPVTTECVGCDCGTEYGHQFRSKMTSNARFPLLPEDIPWQWWIQRLFNVIKVRTTVVWIPKGHDYDTPVYNMYICIEHYLLMTNGLAKHVGIQIMTNILLCTLSAFKGLLMFGNLSNFIVSLIIYGAIAWPVCESLNNKLLYP